MKLQNHFISKIILLSILALGAGCSTQPVKQPDTTNNEKQISEQGNNYPSYEINMFLGDFYSAVTEQDKSRFYNLWDIDGFYKLMSRHSTLTQEKKIPAINGLIKNRALNQQLFDQALVVFKNNNVFITKTHLKDNLIIVRISNGDYSTYVGLELININDKYKIVDLIDYSMGSRQSKKVAYMMDLYYSDDKEDKSNFAKIAKARLLQNTAPQEALTILSELPESVLSQKAILTTYLECTYQLDVERMKEGLELLEKFHGEDPAVSALLSELSLLRNEPQESIRHLNRFSEIIGPDAALYFTLSIAYYAMEDYGKAASFAGKAIKKDVYYHQAYFQLAQIYSKQNKQEFALSALKLLKDNFEYNFKSDTFKNIDEFKPMYQLADFNDWLAELPE